MKIISKQKDYYDNVFSALENTDEKTVFFERKSKTTRLTNNGVFFVNELNGNEKMSEQETKDYIDLTKKVHEFFQKKLLDEKVITNISSGNIAFLTMYGIHDKKYNTLGYLSIEIFVVAGKTKCLFNVNPYQLKGSFKTEVASLPNYMDIDQLEDLMNKFEIFDNELKILKKLSELDLSNLTLEVNKPIVQISLSGYGQYDITFNPSNLKEYNFERIIDPYTIHQEIETYIAQQIIQKTIPSEPTNELKIVNHGFDLRQSFRHRK